jgi:hypothetical protein
VVKNLFAFVLGSVVAIWTVLIAVSGYDDCKKADQAASCVGASVSIVIEEIEDAL